MDKSSILKAFNEHFLEFVNDLQRVFPNNTNIMTGKNAIMSMRKINPRLVIVGFNDAVVKSYKKEIEEGDIEFFITKDYKQDLHNVESSSEISSIIDTFRDPVKNMSNEEQEKVIKYMQNLLKLTKMYFA
tara:strand:+ start:6089 stop:6478 length:390 start_codon:yes stop_codon:yes gene_type:complete